MGATHICVRTYRAKGSLRRTLHSMSDMELFVLQGFDQLCITHCGEVDGILKDASKGQRKSIELAQQVVRQQLATMNARKGQVLKDDKSWHDKKNFNPKGYWPVDGNKDALSDKGLAHVSPPCTLALLECRSEASIQSMECVAVLYTLFVLALLARARPNRSPTHARSLTLSLSLSLSLSLMRAHTHQR